MSQTEVLVSCVCDVLAAKSRALEKKLVQVIKEEDEVMMEN